MRHVWAVKEGESTKASITRNAILFMVLLSGCGPLVHDVRTPVLEEDAEVVTLIYQPSHHGTQTEPVVHTDLEGNTTTSLETVTVDIHEQWGVVFECKHGRFVVMGPEQKHRLLWSSLHPKDSVTVSYQEIYRETIDRDTNETISRSLIDYDFLGAVVKPPEAEVGAYDL